MFIVFEGMDGTGKTTQARMLNEWLGRKGVQTILVKEPGETVLGQKLRKIILTDKDQLCDLAELGLYLADRAEHIDKVVKPALAQDITVISDRYVDSTLAYQCYGKELLEEATIRHLNGLFSFNLLPDHVFVLDMDASKALERVNSRGKKDKYDSQSLDFFSRVQTYYRKLKNYSPRYTFVDADQTPEQIQKSIRTKVKELLNDKHKS